MMSRTQIVLDKELHRRARARAASLDISLAEYVRRLVAADLGKARTAGAVEDVFDLGSSAGGDIAAYKDTYLGEAVAEEASR